MRCLRVVDRSPCVTPRSSRSIQVLITGAGWPHVTARGVLAAFHFVGWPTPRFPSGAVVHLTSDGFTSDSAYEVRCPGSCAPFRLHQMSSGRRNLRLSRCGHRQEDCLYEQPCYERRGSGRVRCDAPASREQELTPLSLLLLFPADARPRSYFGGTFSATSDVFSGNSAQTGAVVLKQDNVGTVVHDNGGNTGLSIVVG